MSLTISARVAGVMAASFQMRENKKSTPGSERCDETRRYCLISCEFNEADLRRAPSASSKKPSLIDHEVPRADCGVVPQDRHGVPSIDHHHPRAGS
jgi:hypothetical protein